LKTTGLSDSEKELIGSADMKTFFIWPCMHCSTSSPADMMSTRVEPTLIAGQTQIHSNTNHHISSYSTLPQCTRVLPGWKIKVLTHKSKVSK